MTRFGKYLFSVFLLLAFVGCGGDSANKPSTSYDSSDTSNKITRKYSIKVVDGYIKNAIIKDSLGQNAIYSGDGEYSFSNEPVGKIFVYGGEFEESGVLNKFDYAVDAKYQIISPLTHFVSKYPEQKANLLNALDLNEADLNEDFYAKLQQNNNEKFQNMVKTAQIFYALEVNDLLKDLKDFHTYDDLEQRSINLANTHENAKNLILKTKNLSKNELLNAEKHLTNVKSKLYENSDKKSGIRLEGEWIMRGVASNCSSNKQAKAKVLISYDEINGYTFKQIGNFGLDVNTCEVSDFTSMNENERTKIDLFNNVIYPLPVSEFDNAIELSKIFTNLESEAYLKAEGLGVKLVSPDMFVNTSKNIFGTATVTYTRVR